MPAACMDRYAVRLTRLGVEVWSSSHFALSEEHAVSIARKLAAGAGKTWDTVWCTAQHP